VFSPYLQASSYYNANGKLGSVRTFHTNTHKRIDTTFPIVAQDSGFVAVLDLKETSMAGVPGEASRIV
jgi:hypothetical protein